VEDPPNRERICPSNCPPALLHHDLQVQVSRNSRFLQTVGSVSDENQKSKSSLECEIPRPNPSFSFATIKLSANRNLVRKRQHQKFHRKISGQIQAGDPGSSGFRILIHVPESTQKGAEKRGHNDFILWRLGPVRNFDRENR